MHLIDFAILGSFILFAVSAGLRARKQASQNLQEYFLAGRSIPGWKAGLSMAATQFAADTPLLVTGLIATAGIFALWQMWIYALSFLFVGFVLGPCWRRASVLTDAEFSELRYTGRPALFLRGFKAIYFGTVFNCAVLAMVLLASTRIAEPFLMWDQWLGEDLFGAIRSFVQGLGVTMTLETADPVQALTHTTSNLISIFVIVSVTAMYSMTGGLRSVIATDIWQFALMMIATLIFSWTAVSAAGGLENLHVQLSALYESGRLSLTPDQITAFDPTQAYGVSIALLLAFAFQWLIQMNSDGTGYIAQRIMACRSDQDAKIATIVFSVAQVLLRSLLWIPLGLALLVLFPPTGETPAQIFKAEREMTFIRGMIEHLPPGSLGLMLTGMLAALASTLDTHLNWGASYWTNDLYKRIWRESFLKKPTSDRSLVWVARLSNLIILFLSLFIMSRLTSIQEAWQLSLMLGAGMGIPLLLRWLWWRMNSWGEIGAIVASLVTAPFALAYFDSDQVAYRLLSMAFVSLVTVLLAVWFLGPESQTHLQNFYNQVRPVGFWGPFHKNESPRLAFAHSSFATILTGLSLFCVLTALGSMLAGSPAPQFFPYPWIWRSGLLVLGLALIPFWWKFAMPRLEKNPIPR